MIRDILQHPNELLRQQATPLDANEQEVLHDLYDTFKVTRDCVGLAAPQIGHNRRVIIVDTTQSRTQTALMVNPVIKKQSVDQQKVWDGCMSVGRGKKRGWTKRPKRITVEWMDPVRGEFKTQKFAGFIAAVIHHEIDHLNGTLFLDRV